MISDRTANVVAAIVTAVWVCNFAAGIFHVNGYQSDPSINAIFTGTVGLAFAARAMVKGRLNGDAKDEEP